MSRRQDGAAKGRAWWGWALCLVAVGAALPCRAAAPDYPSRPIHIVVPFAPGGAVDVIARILAARLTTMLPSPVLIDNRGGAGGIVGTELVTHAPADGYTLLLDSAAIAYDPSLHDDLPYDTLKDLTPVARVGTTPNLLVTNPAFPAHTVKALIDMAKAEPNKVTFGSGGVGSSSHLAFALLEAMSGARFTHVPYKGAGPALIDLLAGRIDAMDVTMPTAIADVQAKRLAVLGVSSMQRLPALPTVPTIAEAGVPGYEYVAWFGVLAPAGTPPAIVDQLNAWLAKATEDPVTRAKLASVGVTAAPDTPAQFGVYLRAEIAKWHAIIKQGRIGDHG